MQNSSFVRFTPWLKSSATVEQGNKRKYMEDRVTMSNFEYHDKNYYIFLLLDGHGGSEVADYVKQHFASTLGKYIIRNHGRKIRRVIKQTFMEMDNRVRQLNLPSGTTASLLLVIDKPFQTWLANVGDSTMYGITEPETRDGKPKIRKISMDHNIKYKSEHKRVIENKEYEYTADKNGYICTEDGHALAVTRAIGDLDFGQGVTAEPTIKKIKIPYSIFVIASDGIWDVMDGKAIWAQLHPPKERKAYRQSAYRLNTWRNQQFPQHDNTSLILVYINHSKMNANTSIPDPIPVSS